MPAIHYLSVLDKLEAFEKWEEVMNTLKKDQLRLLVFLLLAEIDIDDSFKLASQYRE